MKRIPLLLMILLLTLTLFAGCTGKTPDVIESEAAMLSLDKLDWSIPVEIDGASSTTYTLSQAKNHELVKIYCSFRYASTTPTSNPQVTTAIFEGVRFSDFLADIGYPEASSVTIYHTNTNYYAPFEFDYDLIHDPGSIITWIQNKKEIIKDSDSHVGFASEQGGVEDMCHSIAKIVVHP